MHIAISEVVAAPEDTLVLSITSSGNTADAIKLALDESILGPSPAITVTTGSCGLPQSATYVCVPDASGDLVLSVYVPAGVENFSVLDFTAILVSQAGADCAVTGQSLLVVCDNLLPTKPPAPTPYPTQLDDDDDAGSDSDSFKKNLASTLVPIVLESVIPIEDRVCSIDGFHEAPCAPRDIGKMHATCFEGLCRSAQEHFDILCVSNVCIDAPNGTPCSQCVAACGATSEVPYVGEDAATHKLVVRDCLDPGIDVYGDPIDEDDDDDENAGDNVEGSSDNSDDDDDDDAPATPFPTVAPSVCGNGIMELGEECDGEGGDGVFIVCDSACSLVFFWPSLVGLVLSLLVVGGCIIWCCVRALVRRMAKRAARRRRDKEHARQRSRNSSTPNSRKTE